MRRIIFVIVSSSLLCLLPLIEALDANQKLKACCGRLTGADANCKTNYCSFDALSSSTILTFLATCGGMPQTIGPMWDCASTRQDHSPCCRQKGVQANCMAFCSVANGLSASPISYLLCLPAFNAVKQCFAEYLETHPNINGDL